LELVWLVEIKPLKVNNINLKYQRKRYIFEGRYEKLDWRIRELWAISLILLKSKHLKLLW
jgi:hypothetical protein